ncbi:HNH endonuclease signature motif containing protein [Mycobacteroides abscessus]|uniref:HNH endonuclease signature motif containing protein n=1 Tax=Mycobacteroides abscessus TaxID=36809 RepID=UPI00092BB030|nr:HNH endonuclease signature motif containing protein [Mycobacteroides abscessus]SIN33573.1 HNH endonuclease [Mycobacteroides abscessus subsp. abscessus]
MRTLDERFWEKVRPAGALECWQWGASLNDGGYGQIYVHEVRRPIRAHRVAWELLRGEIPTGLVIDHLCRNRRCVNPWHMDLVTNEVNIERGEFRSSRPPLKTHCPSGHAYAGENVRIAKAGYRVCRSCERAQSLAGYYRRKARNNTERQAS